MRIGGPGRISSLPGIHVVQDKSVKIALDSAITKYEILYLLKLDY